MRPSVFNGLLGGSRYGGGEGGASLLGVSRVSSDEVNDVGADEQLVTVALIAASLADAC